MRRVLCHGLALGLSLCACGEDGGSRAPTDAGQDFDAGVDGGEQDGATPPARRMVTLSFEARVGEQAFDCGRSYRGVGTSDVEVVPADLRLFVQDVVLIRRDGVEVPVELEVRGDAQRADVALLDFEDDTGHCVGVGGTASTNTTITGFVPEGDYEGVAFSNGVPEQVNHQNPIDLTAPLVAGPLHWNWLGGFLFVNAQLNVLATGIADGGAAGDAGVPASDAGGPGSAVLHIGSSLCSPNRGCEKGNRNRVVLHDFDPDQSRIVLDMAALFANLDLQEVTTCHAVGVECSSFFPPLGLDYETGAATDTQTLYHVE